MKVISGILLALLISLACFPIKQAQALDLYAFGSYWDQEDTDDTFGAGAGLAFSVFTDHLKVDLRGYYFEGADLGSDDELELIPVNLGLQVHILPSARLDPYILGGVSYVFANADRYDPDSEFGAYVGGGLDFRLVSKLKLFAEVMYRATELSGDFDSIDNDVDVSGVGANAGLKFSF